jgi:hypothetical protein
MAAKEIMRHLLRAVADLFSGLADLSALIDGQFTGDYRQDTRKSEAFLPGPSVGKMSAEPVIEQFVDLFASGTIRSA